MSIDSDRKREFINIYLEGAKDQLDQKKYNLALTSFCQAITAGLSIAVSSTDNVDEGIAVLKGLNIGPLVKQSLELIPQAVRMEDASAFNHITLAHVAWLLDMDEVGKEIILESSKDTYFGTKFLAQYVRVLLNFSQLNSIELKPLKLKGIEKYWAEYLKLMMALVSGVSVDIKQQLNTSAEMFVARNKDNRLNGGGHEIDGVGKCPVKWDFRLVSIVAFYKRNGNLASESMPLQWPFQWHPL